MAIALGCGDVDQEIGSGGRGPGSATDDGDAGTVSATSTSGASWSTTETTLGDATDATDASSGEVPCSGFIYGHCSGTNDHPVHFECDLFAQDCPRGEKCMPWANDGGPAWNATRCSPVAANPASLGDPCMVEGIPVSGIDNCDVGHMCFHVDVQTLEGVCVEFCGGTPDAPLCSSPTQACSQTNDGALALCLERCDPVLGDCVETQACFPAGEAFVCIDGVDEAGAGTPCEYINGCATGHICIGADAFPDCIGGIGCCSPACDVTDPTSDAQCAAIAPTMSCEPWFFDPPPAYTHVGVCAEPIR